MSKALIIISDKCKGHTHCELASSWIQTGSFAGNSCGRSHYSLRPLRSARFVDLGSIATIRFASLRPFEELFMLAGVADP
jgi:hypothetical protein